MVRQRCGDFASADTFTFSDLHNEEEETPASENGFVNSKRLNTSCASLSPRLGRTITTTNAAGARKAKLVGSKSCPQLVFDQQQQQQLPESQSRCGGHPARAENPLIAPSGSSASLAKRAPLRPRLLAMADPADLSESQSTCSLPELEKRVKLATVRSAALALAAPLSSVVDKINSETSPATNLNALLTPPPASLLPSSATSLTMLTVTGIVASPSTSSQMQGLFSLTSSNGTTSEGAGSSVGPIQPPPPQPPPACCVNALSIFNVSTVFAATTALLSQLATESSSKNSLFLRIKAGEGSASNGTFDTKRASPMALDEKRNMLYTFWNLASSSSPINSPRKRKMMSPRANSSSCAICLEENPLEWRNPLVELWMHKPFPSRNRLLASMTVDLGQLPINEAAQHRIDFGFGLLTMTLKLNYHPSQDPAQPSSKQASSSAVDLLAGNRLPQTPIITALLSATVMTPPGLHPATPTSAPAQLMTRSPHSAPRSPPQPPMAFETFSRMFEKSSEDSLDSVGPRTGPKPRWHDHKPSFRHPAPPRRHVLPPGVAALTLAPNSSQSLECLMAPVAVKS